MVCKWGFGRCIVFVVEVNGSNWLGFGFFDVGG